MSNITISTIARPYAKAAFKYATQNKVVKQWSTMLYQLSNIITNSTSSHNLSINKKKFNLILNIYSKYINDKKFKNFMIILNHNNRFDIMPEIYNLFILFKDETENIKNVYIQSAFHISKNLLNKIECILKNKYQFSMKITVVIDRTLIGGLRIVIDNQIIDLSIKEQLKKLKHQLNN